MLFDGRIGAATDRIRAGYAEAIAPPISDYASFWALWLSYALRIGGRVVEAAQIGRQGVSLAERVDPTGVEGAILALEGCSVAELGDGPRLEWIEMRLGQHPPAPPPRGSWHPWIKALRAVVNGSSERARDEFRTAVTTALDDGILATASWILGDAIRFVPDDWSAIAARSVADETGSVSARAIADWAEAVADGDPDRLDVTATLLGDHGAYLWAITALEQAVDLHMAQRHRPAAARSATLAATLRSQFTQLPTDGGQDRPRFLTVRETEVARLAAGGCASRVIADRLHLSVRTVDNHLASVYTKLGLHGRDELRGVLQPASISTDERP